ncbi:MAG: M23 family metallopeptidase [Desulfohalobiaceae bacterium]|nr:M23 family metallopeptidase [Desulfohalobiaceae bacterium]
MNSAHKGKKFLVIFVLLLAVGLSGTYFYFAETELPGIQVSPDKGFVGQESTLTLSLTDKKSGLSKVRVEAVRQGTSRTLLFRDFGQGVHEWRSQIKPGEKGLEDGEFVLRIVARDRSWKNLFKGTRAVREIQYVMDTRVPKINLETFRHNLNQGGAGLVSFRTSEPVQKAGVTIGDYFFPAYKGSDDRYLCLFAFPYNLDPGQDEPLVQVVDRAGNAKQSGFNYHVNTREFDQTVINIPDRFLQTKMSHFQDLYPTVTDKLKLFLKVNQDLREANRKRLREIGLETSSKPLWSGRFLRQKGARKSGFASRRTYLYQGKEIDRQTHLGVDIASLARAGVLAANSGRVVFSDWLGIYGQAVIIDHGLGLQTLYAHLSERRAGKGDLVEKGEIIGRTGATGLAGGDHLHFAVLVSGLPVNPIEWWDQNWVENNIAGKISQLKK